MLINACFARLRTPLVILASSLIVCTAALAANPATPTPQQPTACSDFAAFAALRRQDQPSVNLFEALATSSQQRQLDILKQAAANPTTDNQRLLGNFWAAATAPERSRLDTLKPLLEKVATIRQLRDVSGVIVAAQQQGLPLLFRMDVAADLRDPTRSMLYLRQSGLGLPDRDYYLRQDPQTVALMQHYRAYVERLLVLSGNPAEAAAGAAQVIEFETQLARATLSLGQIRDPNNSYLPTDIDALDKQYSALELKSFFRAIGLRGLKTVSLAHTAFFVQANHLAQAGSLDGWRAYLRFHLVHQLASHLGAGIAEAHQTFVGNQLKGIKSLPPTEIRALRTINQVLPDLLSREFLAASDAAVIQKAQTLIDTEVAALRGSLQQAEWLSESARTSGLEKLDALLVSVGGDSGTIDTGSLSLSRDKPVGNLMQIASWRQRLALTRLGQTPPVDQLPAQRVGAYYDPARNRLVVSAALAAPPLFSADGDPAGLYGGFGALIAHELSHGFDLGGSKSDAHGMAKVWWTAEDYAAYAARSKGLTAQYDAYQYQGAAVDGKRSFLENVADLAGLELAWKAYDSAGRPGAAERDGMTAAQRFFLAWAALWPEPAGEDAAEAGLQDPLHAPAPLRINGPIANIDAFAEAHECKANQGFMLPPERRMHVWR